MKLKLTLVRSGGTAVDLLATASAEVTVGEFAGRLAALDPQPGAHTPAVPTIALVDPDGRRIALDADLPLVEAALASGSVITLAEQALGVGRGSGQDVVQLVVTTGPEAGREFRLPVGTTYIGRDASCVIRLSDPRVGRRHARLHVRPEVEVEDLNSANGTRVGDALVQRAWARPGDVIRVGDTCLSVIPLQAAAVVTERSDSTVVQFNRSPVPRPVGTQVRLQLPEAPRATEGRAFPFLALLAPLVMGAALYAFTHNATSLVFVALSPLLGVAAFLDARFQSRRGMSRERARHAAGLEQVRQDAELALSREQAERSWEAPSGHEVVSAAVGFAPLLWSRRPDGPGFLTLRLGLADLPSRTTFVPGAAGASDATATAAERAMVSQFARAHEVPWTAELPDVGAVGVVGGDLADDVLRSVISQIAGLHSPAEVVICALAGTRRAKVLEWLKWLPHTSSDHSPVVGPHLASAGSGPALVAAVEEVVRLRRGQDHPDLSPAVVLVVDQDAPADHARLVQLAEQGPNVGVYTVWRASRVALLPAACRAYVEIGASSSAAVDVRTAEVDAVVPDRIDAQTAVGLARHLAPVTDAGAAPLDDSDLPTSQSYLRLRGTEGTVTAEAAVEEVVERWRENGSLVGHGSGQAEPSLRALVGRTATDPLYLDLHTQGPHALVGGTTGAGKSELLQTWVLGMALGYSPQRVNFLFVDYKGGAAFAELVKLPHTVGVVTDLTPHLVRRAITSLRAELRHREHLLNEHGSKDLAAMEKVGNPAAPPRLVIVVDEFAALVQEVPEFIDGVVDVAQRGRSLGLHLILATQRPAGVIKENLRANTNLRLALRMADAADSTDVLQEPLAADFDPGVPGRAAVRSGPGRLTVFQTGYVGGWTSGQREAPQVTVAELTFGAGAEWAAAARTEPLRRPDQGPNDLFRMVDWLCKADQRLALPVPRKPWRDVLAPLLDLVDLRPRTDTELPYARVDLPSQQATRTQAFRPDEEGNLVAFGTGGSGKTTLLRTLAAAAGMTRRGGPVQVYAIDAASGGLSMLEALPHVGSVISGDDLERVERLLRGLRALVTDRATRYGDLRAGSVVDYRELAGQPTEPRMLLLIDGLSAVVDLLESSGRSRYVTVLQQIAGEGRQVGVHLAVTADRPSAVPFGMRSTLQHRVVLRQAEEADYSFLGVPSDVLAAASPPGRAVLGELEMQVAVLGGSANVSVQSQELSDLADSLEHVGQGVRARPQPISRMPALVSFDSLPSDSEGRPVIGLEDELLRPFAMEARGVVLVTGPPGSGRTTALAALVTAVLRADPTTPAYYFGSANSPLATARAWTAAAYDPSAAAGLAVELREKLISVPGGSIVPLVVVEGATDIASTAAELPLEQLTRAAAAGSALLISEGETTALASYGTFLQALKAPRRGLVLQPDIGDPDILRTALPKAARRDFPPGRGFFVERGKSWKVQVAMPE